VTGRLVADRVVLVARFARTSAPSAQRQRQKRGHRKGLARLTLSVPRCLLGYRTYIRTQCLGQVMREVLLWHWQ